MELLEYFFLSIFTVLAFAVVAAAILWVLAIVMFIWSALSK